MTPERILESLYLFQKLNRVQRLAHLHKAVLDFPWTRVVFQKSLKRCLGLVVFSTLLAAREPFLRLYFHRRLKTVHIVSYRSVQFVQLALSSGALEAVVADDLAHHRAVLLLDEALVVLPVSAAASERNLVFRTEVDYGVVQELAAVVRVETLELEGKVLDGSL